MSQNRLLPIALLLAALAGQPAGAAPPAAVPPHNPVTALPATPPAWLKPFRLRYALQVGGVRSKSLARSIIAQLPTGGRVRPDAADIAVQAEDGERLPVTILSHDPRGNTLIQFPRHGDGSWYYAYAAVGDDPLPDIPPAREAPFQEGISAEIRRWAGNDLGSWAIVREGLSSSENVIGNAVVAEVIQNCNPVRPNDPRNFAASYRGTLTIPDDGVYRFFLNAEDAAFLFIDGFKVTERVGTNSRMTGAVKVRDMGDDVELKAGLHSFEVHHVVGNNPNAIGYCAMMWVPPGAKAWTYVPHTAFPKADYGRVAQIDEVQNRPAASFVYGIDDTLRSGDGGLVYLLQFAAVGPVGDEKKLQWDFGDGTTGGGLRPSHVYFQAGDYEVTLKSGDLPPFRTNVHVWPAPGNTSPLSLAAALASLSASDWQQFDPDRLNRMFQFLLVCEQPERWPLVDAVARKLLELPALDLKQKVVIYGARMEALSHQGRADEAIRLGEKVLGEFGRVPSLQVGIRLAIAQVYHRHLKKLTEAAATYESIIGDHRRVEHPDVRIAAIRWGDLYAETGDLRRAGECYRLASALGGEAFEGSSLTGAVTRGGLLRTAEQKLKAGDVQQTRQLLERIELHYPEEKLEGLYRLLRADADRRTGRYEEALRNYEILLKLTQWSGFNDRALHGMADTYFRLGDIAKALPWLDTLEKSHPRYYEMQQLAAYRQQLVDRQARLAAAQGNSAAATSFVDVVSGFEPDEKQPWGDLLGWSVAPGQGIAGPHVGFGSNTPTYVGYFDHKRQLPVLTGGEYWVEVWYREALTPITTNPHLHVALHDVDLSKAGSFSGTAKIERTFGVWRKVGFLVQAPPASTRGSFWFSLRLALGVVELDGLSIRAISDRQSDALNNFLKGSDVE